MLEITIAIIVIILMCIMIHLTRKNKINFAYVYLNIVVLILFIVFCLMLLIPEVRNFIIVKLKFVPRDLIMSIAVGYLLYASFIQNIIIAKQDEKINKLAMILSVKEAIAKKEESYEENNNTN